jgi:acyl-coenzyme A synthetase/AMP-(fatty) acid ligase
MTHSTLVNQWLENVAAHPDNVAIRTRRHAITYRDLETHAARYRDLFSAIPGADPVLIVCADPVDIVAALFAAIAGCRPFAPVSVLTPPSRLAAMVADLGPQIVVADEPGGLVLAKAGRTAGDDIHIIRTEDVARAPAPAAGPARWAGAAAADRGYVYFTSGTSGRPKGVRGSVEAIAHFVAWEIAELGVTTGTRVSSLTSPGFDAFLRDALVPLCSGGSMCVAPRSALAGPGLARWLESSEIQLLHCVPTVFRTLRPLGLTAESLPGLRTVMLAGEPLRAADVSWWRGLFGDRKELVNLYGSSETTMGKLFHRITAADETTDRVPVGGPMPGVSVRVLGAENTGDVGEVEITVPFRLLGYLNGRVGGFDLADPYRYRTGDLGRFRADGALEVLGRRDSQVKVRGLRIELDDIANVLLGHPGVHDVHVTVVGEDSADTAAVLRAYVVSTGGWDERELLGYARERLPKGMVPDEFVPVDVLPRTLNGKVDRHLLAAAAASGARIARIGR